MYSANRKDTQAKYYRKNRLKIRQKQKVWHSANKEYVRSKHLTKNFGLTTDQWNWMFKKQRGLCPICLHKIRKPSLRCVKWSATVDHDHETGRVRGLLCPACNRTRIGSNTIETVTRVLDYLESDFDARTIDWS